jgi:hypothetical protein
MFEITGDDIAALNDEDLRTLVGRLCEAELRRRNLSPSAATWGGSHTAKDGGLDVRVALPPGSQIDGFIPRPHTGFQVKKPDMPRAAIIEEMRPAGALRPVIADLAAVSGAYVIISSTGSTADSALRNRREAMAEAIRGLSDESKLALDFFDRNRLATWVRDHAGMVVWVRAAIGKSFPGWRPYGSWSYVPAGIDPAYLADEMARIKTGDKGEGDGLSAIAGINKIRDALRAPGSVVRLVGLSGVGKTRLVEALFDDSIGTGSLDPSLAIYTNIADMPNPQPAILASDLVKARARAILVIDNCPADVHRQLSDIARSAGTAISVVTIEYDIREDQPEGTDVFVLNSSSPTLIEKLVAGHFSALSQIDARTIAEFSGGNARIALALAGTVQKNETVAGLADAELFRRLFHQRHDPDSDLLLIAQACSLVYSFEGQTLAGDNAELPVLGSLVGKQARDVFAAATELKRRDLLQQRGPWRAVLPHGIANRLAAMALENIPHSVLVSCIVEGSSERLLKSFSRRLGYLDGNKEAQAIVATWLAPGGLLADVANLNELGREMLMNVAPVAPEAVLTALENVMRGADGDTIIACRHFDHLLRLLAYDVVLFERAVTLLGILARLPDDPNVAGDTTKIIQPLFYIVLSGTRAPVELRLTIVERWLRSSDALERALGVQAIEAMLKTDHFSSSYSFEFGARSRDYGYHPKTGQDVRDWFEAVLKVAEPFALSGDPLAGAVRSAIAEEFRELWSRSGRSDDLERLARAFGELGFWREGWIAARQTRIHDGGGLEPEMLERLTALEAILRPKDLADKVRGFVAGSWDALLESDEEDGSEAGARVGAAARSGIILKQLGQGLAIDEEAFCVLLPELMHGDGRVRGLGYGVGLHAEKPRDKWSAMVAQLAKTNNPCGLFLCGFLQGLQIRDSDLVDHFLDEALDDPILASWLPELQAGVAIDNKGVARLHRSLERGTAPIRAYYAFAYGGTCDEIPEPEFKGLLLALAEIPDGMPIAVKALSLRIHSNALNKRSVVPEIAKTGRALLAVYVFEGNKGRAGRDDDHDLGTIIEASLADAEGTPIVRRLCRDFLARVARYELHFHEYDCAIRALFKVHPTVMLDELITGDKKAQSRNVTLINNFMGFGGHPMEGVQDDVVLDWCDRDPDVRYPYATSISSLFVHDLNQEPREWKDLAKKLLRKTPNKETTFKEITARLMFLRGGSGRLSTRYEAGLNLIEQIDLADMPELLGPLEQAKATFKRAAESARRRETEEDMERSGRFE